MKGVEKADSFCFNPHKWIPVNYDCSGKRTFLINAGIDRVLLIRIQTKKTNSYFHLALVAFWLKNTKDLEEPFKLEPAYTNLKHKAASISPDYRVIRLMCYALRVTFS